MAEILVVDDDPVVVDVVADYLTADGHRVVRAHDGKQGLDLALAQPPELVILDVMMPGLGGLEVLRRVHAQHPDIPALMLTALDSEPDRILGLETGADDYVTKPFSPRELVLRVNSILRRAQGPGEAPPPPSFADGDLCVDYRGRRATLGETALDLTTREFDLLAHLTLHAGQAFSREQLLNEVWDWSHGDQSTVTVHIRRLREKIERDPSSPQRLATVWGVGYRYDPIEINEAR